MSRAAAAALFDHAAAARAIAAANAQLAVPVIAALAGVVLFGEPDTARLAVSSKLVLGGSALAVRHTLTLRMARGG